MGSTEATKTVLIFYGTSSLRSYSLAPMLFSVEGRGTTESGLSLCFALCPVFCRACRRWVFLKQKEMEGGRIGLLIAVEFDC